MTLRRDRLESLYVQLAEALEREIAMGRYGAFDRLPSEQALMAKHGVSRVTVRQAIALLNRKGLIEVKQGKGTFVGGSVVRHGLDNLTGFYDSLIAQGLRPSTQLLEFRVATPADRASTPFDEDMRRAVTMRRLYRLHGHAFAVVDAIVVIDGTQVSRQQMETHTIYQLLRDVVGEQVSSADIGIRARAVGKRIGTLLKLAAGRPVLEMERVSMGRSGEPVEHSRFCIVPETYEFRLNVSGPLQITSGIQPFSNGRAREKDARTPVGAPDA
jgi:GntR family transcriptional regulator